MQDNLQIPYGIFDFKRIRTEGYCYIDKTGYIPTLEQSGSCLFFVRPRRFGKSLFINMLRCYYDLAEKGNFEKLFGGLAIAKSPTANRNRYQVLDLDFSTVNICEGKTLQERFDNYMKIQSQLFLMKYDSAYGDDFRRELPNASGMSLFSAIAGYAKQKGYPLYLMLDEYDNFTNAMLRAEASSDYRDITHGQGFYREWFKAFKASFDRIFMTGVSPVTMDDLTSGFNIALNISQDPDFNAMLGFSEEEVLKLYTDFKGTGRYQAGDPAEWVKSIKPWYDGYCFSEAKIGEECVFNSDMALYHLSALVKTGRAPKNMVDVNIKTDYDKLQTIADIQRRLAGGGEGVLPVTEEIASTGQIAFDLVESFPADKISDVANFRSLFHYYGILSMAGRERGQTVFKVPNLCVQHQLFGYLRTAYLRERQPDWDGLRKLAARFAYDGEWEPFLRRLAEDYAGTTPVRGGIQGEIRIQGYMQCEFGHLNFYLARPEMELSRGFCDFALFPERCHYGDVQHSYLIELKFSAKDAPEAEIEEKHKEALDQLAAYRADPFVPSLAKGTTLHQIVYQFKGTELVRAEQIAEEAM
ncbi:MAG: AAA family ATPase [Kiritimatiellae bacterium]|nr:AAA family ATPase [Kiritimatiellia bacterium]